VETGQFNLDLHTIPQPGIGIQTTSPGSFNYLDSGWAGSPGRPEEMQLCGFALQLPISRNYGASWLRRTRCSSTPRRTNLCTLKFSGITRSIDLHLSVDEGCVYTMETEKETRVHRLKCTKKLLRSKRETRSNVNPDPASFFLNPREIAEALTGLMLRNLQEPQGHYPLRPKVGNRHKEPTDPSPARWLQPPCAHRFLFNYPDNSRPGSSNLSLARIR